MSDFNPLDRARISTHRSSLTCLVKNCLQLKSEKFYLAIGKLPFLAISIVFRLTGLLVLFQLIPLLILVSRSIMTFMPSRCD